MRMTTYHFRIKDENNNESDAAAAADQSISSTSKPSLSISTWESFPEDVWAPYVLTEGHSKTRKNTTATQWPNAVIMPFRQQKEGNSSV